MPACQGLRSLRTWKKLTKSVNFMFPCPGAAVCNHQNGVIVRVPTTQSQVPSTYCLPHMDKSGKQVPTTQEQKQSWCFKECVLFRIVL